MQHYPAPLFRVFLPILLSLVLPCVSAGQTGKEVGSTTSPTRQARSLSSFQYGQGGFHLYSLSVSGGNYWDGVPSLGASGNVSSITSSASMGWTHLAERSSVKFGYTPSYSTYVQFPDLNMSGHAASFSASRSLSRNWSWTGGIAGNYSSTEQMLFTPTVFRTAASVPATFDELADSLLRSAFTNDQLASMLTGAPAVEVPSRQLLFGDTVLSASGQMSLTYSLSTRMSVSFSTVFSRLQPVSTDRGIRSARGILGQSTSGNVSTGISYSISPRTQVGFSVNEGRTISRFQDTYHTTASAFIGRKLTQRWFAQVYGGGGGLHPIRTELQLPSGPQYHGGGSVGVRTYSHTVLFSSGRTFGDRYGIGAASTVTASGAWNWSHPGRSWSTFVTMTQQWFQGGTPAGLNGWQASGGFSKALSSHLSISANYSHSTAGQTNLIGQLTQRAASVSLIWTPETTVRGRL